MEFKKEIIENRQREEEQYKVSRLVFAVVAINLISNLHFQIMQCTSELDQALYVFSFSSYTNANLY